MPSRRAYLAAAAIGVGALTIATPAMAALQPAPCADCKPISGVPGKGIYVAARTFACDPVTGERQWMVDFGVPKAFVLPSHIERDRVTHLPHRVFDAVAVRFYFVVTNQSPVLEPGPTLTPGHHVEIPITINRPGPEVLAVGWQLVDVNGSAYHDATHPDPLGGKTLTLNCECDTTSTSVVTTPTSSPPRSTLGGGGPVASTPGPGVTAGPGQAPIVGQGVVHAQGGELPATGSDTVPLIGVAVMLGCAGGIFVAASRKRPRRGDWS